MGHQRVSHSGPEMVHRVILHYSSIRGRNMEDTRRATSRLSLQVTQHRVHEQDFPSQYRRAVSVGGALLINPFP